MADNDARTRAGCEATYLKLNIHTTGGRRVAPLRPDGRRRQEKTAQEEAAVPEEATHG